VPPGVDVAAFRPLAANERTEVRKNLGLGSDSQLVLSVSRLVPRKGMDSLIRAVAELSASHPRVELAISGEGRDRQRLEKLIGATGAPARLLGRVTQEELPGLYGCADVFAMACRNRWGGLEQEGFGIVFLEAASAGVAQVAGRSGGAADAVVDGDTGFVVDAGGQGRRGPGHATLARRLSQLLDDDRLRTDMGHRARLRAVSEFDYDVLARQLHQFLTASGG
ncbi:MAG: glycosyltransferase family 4 protein, partial [Acidimicrobiales bacterium]